MYEVRHISVKNKSESPLTRQRNGINKFKCCHSNKKKAKKIHSVPNQTNNKQNT